MPRQGEYGQLKNRGQYCNLPLVKFKERKYCCKLNMEQLHSSHKVRHTHFKVLSTSPIVRIPQIKTKSKYRKRRPRREGSLVAKQSHMGRRGYKIVASYRKRVLCIVLNCWCLPNREFLAMVRDGGEGGGRRLEMK